MTAIFQLRDVVKTHVSESVSFRLTIPHLEIRAGDKVALEGESGCGKSTLLDLLAPGRVAPSEVMRPPATVTVPVPKALLVMLPTDPTGSTPISTMFQS